MRFNLNHVLVTSVNREQYMRYFQTGLNNRIVGTKLESRFFMFPKHKMGLNLQN